MISILKKIENLKNKKWNMEKFYTDDFKYGVNFCGCFDFFICLLGKLQLEQLLVSILFRKLQKLKNKNTFDVFIKGKTILENDHTFPTILYFG